MTWWAWLLIATGVVAVLLLVAALSVRRSREVLAELAHLIPTCLALLRYVMRYPDVPKHAKVAPALVYLAIPSDLIPDFIPGLGQLDDALVLVWANRQLVAAAGRDHVAAHWTGSPDALESVLRLARVP